MAAFRFCTRVLLSVSLAWSACGRDAPADLEPEPAEPSAPLARFADEEAGAPDVGAARLRVLEAGRLTLPKGELGAADAFINDSPIVISGLPRNELAVEVLLAEAKSDARVAAARIRVPGERVESWRLLGQVGIDSSTAAFFSPSIVRAVEGDEAFTQALVELLNADSRTTYSIVSLPWKGTTYVAFTSGFGDGAYPVFLGSSAAGIPAEVLIDFEVLPWADEDAVP